MVAVITEAAKHNEDLLQVLVTLQTEPQGRAGSAPQEAARMLSDQMADKVIKARKAADLEEKENIEAFLEHANIFRLAKTNKACHIMQPGNLKPENSSSFGKST